MKTFAHLIAAAALLAAATSASAQHAGHGHHGHGHSAQGTAQHGAAQHGTAQHGTGAHAHGHGQGAHAGHATPSGPDNAVTRAFKEANDRMHRDMDIAFTGDADADFARGMIPHHKGAVDMARIVLQHGKDPAIRKLAEEVIRTQEAEIKMMSEWLAARGK